MLLQVGSIIEHAFGSWYPWRPYHTGNLNFLPDEEACREDALRCDGHTAHCRLRGFAVATQGDHVNPGLRAPRLLLVAFIDALGGRLAENASERDDFRLLAQYAAQVVRR